MWWTCPWGSFPSTWALNCSERFANLNKQLHYVDERLNAQSFTAFDNLSEREHTG